MNKNVIFLIIILLLLIFGIGFYLISNNHISNLDINSTTDNYQKNDSNSSLNESIQEEIQDNNTETLVNNNNFVKGNYSGYNQSKIKTITSKSDVVNEANKILNNNKYFFGKNAVVKNVKYDGNGLWSIDFVDSKTGEKVGTTYIDDKTGKMVDAM